MDTKPRKLPRQSRSKVTFDAIVEATTQILVGEGYDDFTTARAARRAGVSVGSLYQYFPNKVALTAAVIDRACENFLEAFEESLACTRGGTLAECIEALVERSFTSHHLDPDLHRIVNELAHRIGVADRIEDVSRAAAKMIEATLCEHADEIDPQIDLAVAAMIIETLLETLAHRVQLADPPVVRNEDLAVEARRMMMRYLSRDR